MKYLKVLFLPILLISLASCKEKGTDSLTSYDDVEGIVFSHETGFYDSSFSLSLTANKDSKIYYTLDSSIPDENSNLYTGPITISDNSGTQMGSTFSYKINAIQYEKIFLIFPDIDTRL